MSIRSKEDAQFLWDRVMESRRWREKQRLKPVLTRLYDGDFNLRGVVAGERKGEFEFIDNDTGTASLQLSLDHYLAKWVMDFRGRAKRNVHVTFDKQGARWSGRMESYRVVREESGDCYLEITFLHDIEELKHMYCWANPFLRPEFQFPKMWVIFGPAKWCLLVTLFVNLFRLETSWLTLPDNPLDPTEWMGLSFLPSNWRNICSPLDLLDDNSNLAIVFSRFKSMFDVAKRVMEDAQLSWVPRRYLKGEDPHPFAHKYGGILNETTFPLRNGCLVWDIEDKSGWGTETAFGGSILVGLVRAIVNIASDGTTEGVEVYHGDPTYPGEYYVPWFLGTNPKAPHVVYQEGPLTGIKSSEFKYYEATDTSFLTGGQSMPGVNEAISAVIQMGGDLLAAHISAAIEVQLPPIGGAIDAIANPIYSDTILAFMEIPTLRAMELSLPLPGLENALTGLGDFHYYEGWADGADKAFTLSAIMAIRAKIWSTRAHTSHTIKILDAAPYYIGAPGYGHFWLGDRIGTTVLGFPDPYTIFVERVNKLHYAWGKDGDEGWTADVGYREPQDPMLKTFEMIRDLNSSLGDLGVL